ncbi:glutamic acid-rich protein isoform X2 [Strongylocentrotus purpuratus]|uniref:Uncharacterized protein n=1 Tax=Strongylocentrotus purpuratus TaxID=7668 RepID=A0A7M7P8J7_STRPU|nr:glutamic acid-rich protein isoform X2 [Strongylocentrotus purpuratus]
MSSPVSSWIGSNPEHIVNMLKYRISPAIYLPHIERGGTLLELLDILGKDSNSEESVAESERDEEELVPVKIEQEEEKESESGDSNDNDVDNVLVPVKIEYEEDELQEEEEKEPENGDSDDSDDNDIDNVLVPVKIEHDKDTEKLHPVETIETNKSVNEGVNEEWDPTNDIDFYVQLFTSEGGLKEADVTQSGIQISASSIREKGKLCVEYRNKKGEVNEKEQEEENNDEEEEEEEENDNEGEEEVEEEGEELQEEDDNDVHNLVLVPVNIEHEQNEKHKSKDEKLHPVDTVEKRKFLDERETEELDPKNDIDAPVELFTSDGGSKEADVKQSGRQKAASSVRNKGKRFRITRVCEICSASTDDMSKHLERTHKLSKEERQKYLLAARGRIPIRRRAMIENPSTGRKQSKRADCPLCQGKNYTSLQNHFETKHGLEANEAKEIRKRMKQGVELVEADQLGTDAADSEREESEMEEDMKEHQESLEDAGMNKKQRQTEEESNDEDNEDDEGDDKDEDWVPPRDWKNTRQQECDRPNVEKENKKEEEHEKKEEEEDDNKGEEEEEEEGEEPQEEEKEPDSVISNDNDVHNLVLGPVNIEHEKNTENEKHKSKDEKLHPVETVETSKSLDEGETQELDPKNGIDAPVELFTSDGGSKEADVKQSGRQKSASSIRKKGKRFRITRHCEICSASTDDMSKHLERTHKLSKEERQKYILAARGRVPIRRRAMIENPSSGRKQSKRENCPLCEGKHYTSLQNHLETKHGLEANEAKEIRKRMKQGFVKQGPGVELDEAHQLGTDAADFETNDLLSRYRSFINLASDTTYGESSSTQHCRQLKKMCEMAFSKLLKGGLTPRINDDVVPSGECSKQKEREASNSQMDAVKDVPGEGACSSVEERPTKRKRKLLDSEEEDILRTEVQQAVNKPRRKGLRFREIIAEAYSNSQLKNVVVVQQYYDKARYMGLLK